MRTLFWNYIKRVKWAFLGFFYLIGIFIGQIFKIGEGEVAFAMSSFALGPVLLLLDINKTFSVERTIPISRKEFGTLYWLKGVMFPLIIILPLAWFVFRFEPTSLSNVFIFPWCIVLVGASFTLLTFYPFKAKFNFFGFLKIGLFIVVMLGSVFGVTLLPFWLSEKSGKWDIEVFSLFTVLLALTFFSWFRKDTIVDLGSLYRRKKLQEPPQKDEMFFLGKTKVLLHFYSKNFLFGSLMSIIFFMFLIGFNDDVENTIYVTRFFAYFLVFYCVLVGPALLDKKTLNIKSLKILPVKPKNLCFYLYLIPFVWCTFLYLGYCLLLIYLEQSLFYLSIIQSFFFSVGALFLILSYILRHGTKEVWGIQIGVLILLIPTMILGWKASVYDSLLNWLLLGSGLAFILLGFGMGVHVLKTNSDIYFDREG